MAPLRIVVPWPLHRRQPVVWIAGVFAAIIIGAVVGSTRSVELLAALAMLMTGWIGATLVRRTALYVTALNVLLLLVLPSVLANALSFQPVFMVLAANVGVLAAAGMRGPLRREDVGMLIVLAAVVWPYVVGGPYDSLLGALGIVVIMYLTGRLSGVEIQSYAALLLVAGAVHGAIAIAQSIPALSALVPFQPLRDGLPVEFGRASGLFNNPNTLGTLEAIVLVIAVRIGAPRWTLPLVALCVGGLLLSTSREAVFGLLVGIGVLGFGRFRQMVGWASVLLIVAGTTIWVFPSLSERLDPSGFATDPNLLGRYDLWSAALDLIKRSPVVGYGPEVLRAGTVTDNAYLAWLVEGGVVGLLLWIVGAVIVTPRLLWPALAAMLAIAVLGNPFGDPTYAAFLSSCGLLAADAARARSRVLHGTSWSVRDGPKTVNDRATQAVAET